MKALALTAGDETVVILKVDLIYVYEGMVFDLEQRLGPDFAGKVIITSSHSHSAWAQHYYGGPLQLGGGVFRELVYNRFLDAFEATAKSALAARRDAKIGIFFDGNFDPTNQVNHDRRGENDMLPGGNVKDNHFYMIRVDGMDDVPIAALPVFGEHGTLNSEDNPLASTDAPGALERVMQEQFHVAGRRDAPAERGRRQLAVGSRRRRLQRPSRQDGRSVLLVGDRRGSRPRRGRADPDGRVDRCGREHAVERRDGDGVALDRGRAEARDVLDPRRRAVVRTVRSVEDARWQDLRHRRHHAALADRRVQRAGRRGAVPDR